MNKQYLEKVHCCIVESAYAYAYLALIHIAHSELIKDFFAEQAI